MNLHGFRIDHGHLVGGRSHLAGAGWVQCGLGILADPLEDFLVGLHVRTRGNLAVGVLLHCWSVQQLTGDLDSLDPFTTVLISGQVVEQNRRLDFDVRGGDVNMATGVRVHRTNVELETVRAIDLRAVVTHGQRQEVEHQVRVGLVVVGAGETAALEVRRRHRALVGEHPPQANERPTPLLQVRL